jgi:hypothetical protein
MTPNQMERLKVKCWVTEAEDGFALNRTSGRLESPKDTGK